jgi:Alpha/beta hydrolase family
MTVDLTGPDQGAGCRAAATPQTRSGFRTAYPRGRPQFAKERFTMFKRCLVIGVATTCLLGPARAQQELDIKSGASVVSTLTMGHGDHAVIALHGGSGTDRNFFFQARGGKLGQKLARAGFRVIAPTWAGQSGAGFSEVAAAIAHAQATGARKISLIGHSRGGELVASYALAHPDGTFDTVIQLASSDDQTLAMTKTKKLFAFSKYDKWPQWQARAYARPAEPKRIIEIDGGGHAVGAMIAEKPDLVQDLISVLAEQP